MSGRTIFEPTPSHDCASGWTRVPVKPSSPFAEFATHTMRPPFSGEFPVGCRWQCDDCGQVWVRRKPRRQYPNPNGGQYIIGGEVRWRRETWLERRRRQRKTLSPPIKAGDVD